MFFGSHEHVLDDKGRTSLPKEFRDTLTSLRGQAWITAYPRCLAILPPAAFKDWQARLTGENARLDDAAQRIRRLILGMAVPCNFDRQGRILIPTPLRVQAGIERELVFMGVGDEIEVWDRSRHLGEISEAGANYREDSREVLSRRDD
jgi:MraZ protein